MNEEGYIRRFRWATLVSGSVLVILLVTAWVKETFMADWKRLQKEYRQLALEGSVEEETSLETSTRILQVSPTGLNRTDRCITCHLGMENPFMAGAPQPHALHPGNYIADHPVEKFGCTICHGGQGRAVDRVPAFGEDPSVHWDFPLLHPPYIESSCGKCHLSIFSGQIALEGTATFVYGKEVFSREGCLGCHRARGVGGIIGPDLTGQGEKTKHEYSFTNIKGEQTISNWLKEHFRDPEMVSPGSDMLKLDLPEEELEALATFTMGLAKPDISYDYLAVEALQEFRGMRAELSPTRTWSITCSSCHGKEGKGKDYETYRTGVPSLWNYDFIRVAPDELIEFTLNHGRGARQMASWLPLYSGLKESEIDSLVWMLDWKFAPGITFWEVSGILEHPERRPPGRSQPERGREIYLRDCAFCHGEDGSGDIGLPLSNGDFLSAASDRFLYYTIVNGRNMSGMPAWSAYSGEDLAGLIRFIRHWAPGPREDREIELPTGDPRKGDLQYHYLCSRCHGEFGEGNTGPAILARDFQSHASDRFLYETISGGRSHTAMFGWSTQVQGAGRLDRQGISDIIAFMRQCAAGERDYIYQGSNPGNSVSGKELFIRHCSRCHGEDGQGTSAPALNNQEFLSAASNGYLIATITIGRQGTRMPSWGKGTENYPALSSAERRDVAAYVRSWQRFRIRK
jgi:mono/diheme cytochrome c family protein